MKSYFIPLILTSLIAGSLINYNIRSSEQAGKTVSVNLNAAQNVATKANLADHENGTEGKIHWISMQQALENNKKQKKQRKILIDFYTDWCGWCKRMDASTFSNPQIIEYINSQYWAVKFDAESKESISYQGKTYEFQKGGRKGTNGLALELAAKNGRIGYPTLTLLNEQSQVLDVLPGYKDAGKMDKILKYYGENYYQDFDFNSFLGFYNSPLD